MSKLVEQIARSNRLAGAYLFLGPPGAGKKEAAENFSSIIACQKQDKFVLAQTGASIKIDQIRGLLSLIRYGPSVSPYLVAIIEKADLLTPEAAAAFLKTLEEPPPRVIFILLVERKDKLPATIGSRCQKIVFAENLVEWEKKDEWGRFYKELQRIGNRSAAERLLFSKELEKEREGIEELLYDLVFFARYELLNVDYARIILDTLCRIKRKANLRLALDVMCFKLGVSHA